MDPSVSALNIFKSKDHSARLLFKFAKWKGSTRILANPAIIAITKVSYSATNSLRQPDIKRYVDDGKHNRQHVDSPNPKSLGLSVLQRKYYRWSDTTLNLTHCTHYSQFDRPTSRNRPCNLSPSRTLSRPISISKPISNHLARYLYR